MALTTPIALIPGRREKVVDAASATGTAKAQQFVLPGKSRDFWGQLVMQGVLAGTITGFTVDLEVSMDAGTTFSKFSSHDLVAQGAQAVNLSAGDLIYRFNITTYAGSGTGDVYVQIG